MPSTEGLVKALKPELDKMFKPAFLGRMVIIPYFPVRDENLQADRAAQARQDRSAGIARDAPGAAASTTTRW